MLLSLSGLNAQRLPAPLPVWHASTDALGLSLIHISEPTRPY